MGSKVFCLRKKINIVKTKCEPVLTCSIMKCLSKNNSDIWTAQTLEFLSTIRELLMFVLGKGIFFEFFFIERKELFYNFIRLREEPTL